MKLTKEARNWGPVSGTQTFFVASGPGGGGGEGMPLSSGLAASSQVCSAQLAPTAPAAPCLHCPVCRSSLFRERAICLGQCPRRTTPTGDRVPGEGEGCRKDLA